MRRWFAATVIAWLSESGKLATFGAYTAELELDIARSANRFARRA